MSAPVKARLNVFKWVAILPQIADLVGEIVKDLQDGKLDAPEIEVIGSKLVAIVASVV